MADNRKSKKLPPLFVIKATIGLRNFLVRISKRMLPANFVLLEEASSFWKSKSIAVAAQLNIPDYLEQGVLSVGKLAELAECNKDALYRMLRTLAGEGIFIELPGKQFKNSALSKAILTKKESVKYFVMHHVGTNNWDLVGDLYNCVKTGENAITHKFHMQPFEFLEKNPDKNDIFNKAMTETAELSGSIFVNSYNFGQHKLIVDIGGGQGHLLSQILSKYPSAQAILFDQPHVVTDAREILKHHGVENRCKIVEGSFYETIPSGGDLYILKNILHDWDDTVSVEILKKICATMQPESKLMLIETIIKPDNKPSFGKFVDLQMLIGTIGGKERTHDEYQQMLSDSGFKLHRIIQNATPFSFIIAVKQ
ncbi:MAG: methyltransferase [Bacteroidota bacterium]